MRNTMFSQPRSTKGAAAERAKQEERAMKPHYFPKWLVEAGLPDHVIATLLVASGVEIPPPKPGSATRMNQYNVRVDDQTMESAKMLLEAFSARDGN